MIIVSSHDDGLPLLDLRGTGKRMETPQRTWEAGRIRNGQVFAGGGGREPRKEAVGDRGVGPRRSPREPRQEQDYDQGLFVCPTCQAESMGKMYPVE